MQAVTLKDARMNRPQLVDRLLADAEPTIVPTPTGPQVVVGPLDQFDSWKGALYLLSSPANAARLRQSLEEAETGRTMEPQLAAA